MKSQSGMTLAEVLLMGAIGVLVTMTFYVVFRSGQTNLAQSSKKLRLQQAAAQWTAEFIRLSKNMGYACRPGTYDSILAGTLTADFLANEDNSTTIVLAPASNLAPWHSYSVVDGVLSYDSSGNRALAIAPTWKPVTHLGDTLRVSNPKPFFLLGGRRDFKVDFGYLKLSSMPTDSIGLTPLYVACLRR